MAAQKPLILIVDDDTDVSQSIAEAVEDSGRYSAITADSPEKAFSVIRNNRGFLGMGRNRIGLILLDIRMPGMTGIEFLEKLKEQVDARIDVVMVTAFDDLENWADTMFSYDVVSFLTKPVDRKGLLELIDAYFKGEKEELRQNTIRDFGTRNVFSEIRKIREEKP